MKDVLVIFLFCFLIGFGISIFMIKRYLWKRNLSPTWKLVSGFIAPWTELGAYISNTKKENGRIGIWFKLMVVSFAAMIWTAVILAIL